MRRNPDLLEANGGPVFDVRQKRDLSQFDAVCIAESVAMLNRSERVEVAVAKAIRSIEDRCGGEAIPDDWLPEIRRAVEIGFPDEPKPLRAGQWFR